MTDLRAAAEMALEALEAINEMSKPPMNIPLAAEIDDAMDALRQALAQPAWDASAPLVMTPHPAFSQNPLDIADRAYFAGKKDGIEETLAQGEPKYSDIVSDGGLDPRNKFDTEPEQEPVLWKWSGDGWSYEKPIFPATPLYAAPPIKPWVSLSDEEIDDTWRSLAFLSSKGLQELRREYARAIEAALRSKNNG